MVTACASKHPLSPNSLQIYEAITSVISTRDPQLVGISLSDVNERILGAVATNLSSPVHIITTELKVVLETLNDIADHVTLLPTAAAEHIASMPTVLKVDTISTIPSRVKILLANFQNAVEDPKSLYPRLICCDIPVDPARVVNFSKKYHLLDRMLQAEAADDVGNRSMPSAPKSPVDVITNVNSSLESISDLLCESVNNVTAASESFETIQGGARDLACIGKLLDQLTNQHKEMNAVFDNITLMLSGGNKPTSVERRDLENGGDVIQVIQTANTLIESLAVRCSKGDLDPSLQDSRNLLSDFVRNATALLIRAKKAMSNLTSILWKFITSLPRIARELRQFFVPTGFRALILKPSPDLMSLLQSIEDLRTVLPQPDTIEKSALDSLEKASFIDRAEAIREKLDRLGKEHGKLFEVVESQNLQATINDTVKQTLEAIFQDLQNSASGIMGIVEGNIDEIGDQLGRILPFDGEKRGGKENAPAGLVENVIGAGGLLGKLFEA